MSDTAQARYSTGAIVLHWLIAILVIVNWRIAEGAEHLEGAAKSAAIAPHKAIGITILVLTVLRLLWRMAHKPPALPEALAGWEKLLARSVHGIFYVLLIGLPIGGWLASSYAGQPVDFFGLFELPRLPVAQNIDQAVSVIGAHKSGGALLLILVVIHILGAAKHHFIDKLPSFSRMWPGKG